MTKRILIALLIIWCGFAQNVISGINSFVDKGDGTIIDVRTGLMWQQVPPNDTYIYAAAMDYCDDLTLGEHDDWRIPEVKESLSIIDYKLKDPALDPIAFPRADRQIGNFWVHSTDVEPKVIRAVRTNWGTVSDPLETALASRILLIRCVRSLN